jgi:hypothetical protein
MSRRAQTKLLLPSMSPENQVLLVEEFSQPNQTEEPVIMELDNEINIHDATLTCKYNEQGQYFDNK